MAPHLPGEVARSEHDPDLEAASADIAQTAVHYLRMHRFTGTFADPLLEVAFAAELFRLALPLHVFLLTLVLAFVVWVTLASPAEPALWGMIAAVSLSLVGRALLHRVHDVERAQRVGSWTWVLLLLVSESLCWWMPCELARRGSSAALVAGATAIVSGSHGLSCLQKCALVGFVGLTKLLIALVKCQDSTRSSSSGSSSGGSSSP